MKRIILAALVGVLSACAIPQPNVVSKSSAGITLKSRTVYDIGGAALKRDQLMGETAQKHCGSQGKGSVQTLRDNDGRYVTATYECR